MRILNRYLNRILKIYPLIKTLINLMKYIESYLKRAIMKINKISQVFSGHW